MEHHTHECRDCGDDIACSSEPCQWDGGNDGCTACAFRARVLALETGRVRALQEQVREQRARRA